MRKDIIEVKDLVATYGEDIILEGISFEVHEGEIFVVLGGSGSGKSTLLKHLIGLVPPGSGEIIIDGEDSRKSSVAEIARKVGIVFQNPDYQLFSKTVSEELAFGPRNIGVPEESIPEKVNNALEALNILKYAENSPFLLSEGERRRVAIASILTMNSIIICFDEPTLGQDSSAKKRFSELLSYRKFVKGELEIRSWDGIGLAVLWRTRKLSGYFSDFAIGDFDNDGKDELVAALVIKTGLTVATTPKSTVIAYELQ